MAFIQLNFTRFSTGKAIRISKIVILCLAAAASPAWAEWTFAAINDGNDYFYIDYSTIREEGNLRKVWELGDFNKKREKGQMSTLYRSEYDCKEERARLIAWIDHEGRMGNGKTLGSDDFVGKWGSFPPGSIGASILKKICAR